MPVYGLTIEIICKLLNPNWLACLTGLGAAGTNNFAFAVFFGLTANKFTFRVSNNGTTYTDIVSTSSHSLPMTSYQYFSFTYDKSSLNIYLNGTIDGTPVPYSGAVFSGAGTFNIATSYFYHWAYSWDGPIDEVRYSKAARSNYWINTTYSSNRDNLITFL
jgi:hypothetical protein